MFKLGQTFKTKLANTAARFKADEKGNFAIIGAVTVAVVIAGLAVAIDIANGQSAKQRLQDTTDAIALLAAKGQIETQADLDAAANEYLQSAYPGTEGINIRLEDIRRDGDLVTVVTSNKIPTYFASIFGTSGLDIGVSSQAVFADTQLEIAMVLDTTGSMRDPASGSNGSKLDSLKIAANGLVNQLEANNSRGNISMSVVPFAQYVNVGPNNVNANWVEVTPQPGQSVTSWNGCVGSRQGNLDERVDVSQNAPVPATTGLPECPTALAPLSSNLNTTRTTIADLNAEGWTYLPAGLSWGHRALDSRAPFTQAVAASDTKTEKIMIVMTDGENTRSKSGSFHNGQSQVNADRKAADICNNIKDDNITVYTIAYEVNDTQTENLLRGCASNPDNYFDATNAGDLMEAFDVIAASLTQLRITA